MLNAVIRFALRYRVVTIALALVAAEELRKRMMRRTTPPA